MIHNGNVIKNKLIKIKILNSFPIFNKKFVPVEKITIGIKKGIIKINWINLFFFTWSEINAERIEIKLNVGKARIIRKIVSSRKNFSTLKKIDEIGIKMRLGTKREIVIARHFERKMDISE